MALIKCPECGKEVSDKATACIHCGYPLGKIEEKMVEVPVQITESTKPEKEECWKCPSCGQISKQFGVYYCPKCNVRYVKYDDTQDKDTGSKAVQQVKPVSQKKHKVWLIIFVLLLCGFIVWKIVGPKTIESGNGYSHQVWNFKEECDYEGLCHSENATHRIHHFFGDYGYYCDECWERFDGQESFDRLAKKSSKSSSSSRETDAKICAKKAVEDQLKSPSTAKFCKYTEMTATNLGGNKWKVSGYVDAQNSFGATLRNNWTVTLTLTTSGFTDATVTFK